MSTAMTTIVERLNGLLQAGLNLAGGDGGAPEHPVQGKSTNNNNYYQSQNQWGSGTTRAAEGLLIILVISWTAIICLRLALTFLGRWGGQSELHSLFDDMIRIILIVHCLVSFFDLVKFGTLVGPPPPPIQVQLGVNPADGQPIYGYQQQYRHWCLKPRVQWAANCIQLLILSFFILAVAVDSWSTMDYSVKWYDSQIRGYYTINIDWMFGLISLRGKETVVEYAVSVSGESQSYSDLCSNFDTSGDKDACGTLRATGAFLLIWSLIGGAFMLSLVVQILRSVCQPQATQWYTWQYQAAIFQSQQLSFMIVLWSFGGQMNLGQLNLGLSLNINFATSWWIILACWVLSVFMIVYYRAAIQYRVSGAPAPPTEGGVFIANGVRIQSPSMVQQPQQQQQFPPDVNMIQMQQSYPQSNQQLQQPSYQPRPYPQQQQPYQPQPPTQSSQSLRSVAYSSGTSSSPNPYAPSDPNQFQLPQGSIQPQRLPRPSAAAQYPREGETEEGEIVEQNFANIAGSSKFH